MFVAVLAVECAIGVKSQGSPRRANFVPGRAVLQMPDNRHELTPCVVEPLSGNPEHAIGLYRKSKFLVK